MKKLLGLLGLAFLLAACQQTTNQPSEPPSNSVTTVAEEAINTTEETAVSPAISVASITPATSVAEASQVRDRDWVKGATEPKVVIIEYGDFQ